MAKVTMRSNGDVQEVLYNGKRLMMDDGINLDALLGSLSMRLGFEYSSESGQWCEECGAWMEGTDSDLCDKCKEDE